MGRIKLECKPRRGGLCKLANDNNHCRISKKLHKPPLRDFSFNSIHTHSLPLSGLHYGLYTKSPFRGYRVGLDYLDAGLTT